MRIVEIIDVVNPQMATSPLVRRAWTDVQAAIHSTVWPHTAADFRIKPVVKGNGVKPIKEPCMNYLQNHGWETECLPRLASNVLTPGDLDALLEEDNELVLLEWETGNISSSHRAINKLLLGMQQLGQSVAGSFLIVPSKALAAYLTDRIGNIAELRPYFPLWSATTGIVGLLRIIVVEHDRVDELAPIIPKGRDGMAIQSAVAA